MNRSEEMKGLENIIKNNIQFERLKKEYAHHIEMIDGMYDLILETLLCNHESIHIARDVFPKEIVHAKFYKLKYEHIKMIIENLKRYSNQVVNKKKYLLAALFNAPSVFDSYVIDECCGGKKIKKKENEKNKISTQIEQYDYDFDELERLLVINN